MYFRKIIFSCLILVVGLRLKVIKEKRIDTETDIEGEKVCDIEQGYL